MHGAGSGVGGGFSEAEKIRNRFSYRYKVKVQIRLLGTLPALTAMVTLSMPLRSVAVLHEFHAFDESKSWLKGSFTCGEGIALKVRVLV